MERYCRVHPARIHPAHPHSLGGENHSQGYLRGKPVNILCIDTSGEVLSLGLKNGEAFLENIRDYGLRHAETPGAPHPVLDGEMNLSPKALDLVVCTRGPAPSRA